MHHVDERLVNIFGVITSVPTTFVGSSGVSVERDLYKEVHVGFNKRRYLKWNTEEEMNIHTSVLFQDIGKNLSHL